jgi:hypothetical protein
MPSLCPFLDTTSTTQKDSNDIDVEFSGKSAEKETRTKGRK